MPIDPEKVIKELRAKKGLSRADAIAAGVRTGRLTVKEGELYAFDTSERLQRLNVGKTPKPVEVPAANKPLPTFDQTAMKRHARRNKAEKRVMNEGPPEGTPERRGVRKPLPKGPEPKPYDIPKKPSTTPARAGQPSAAEQLAAQKALQGVEDAGFARKILRKLFGGSYNPAWDLMDVEQIKNIMNQGPKPASMRGKASDVSA